MNLNKVLLIGRLTADPQLRSTKSGQNVATFSIATNRVWTDKSGQKQEEVSYHNIVVWARQAEIVSKFLVKGQMVFVEGRLQTRSYDDKQGQKRYVTEIIAERVQFGPKAGGARSESSAAASQPAEVDAAKDEIPTINLDEEISAEDLPF